MVFPDMRTVLGLDGFAGHARSDDLGQAVDVDRVDAQARLDLPSHFVGPGFGAEQADAQTGAVRLDALARQFVGDGQRIGRRGHQHGGLEVHDHLHLLLGLAARHRNHGRAETFDAVMRAEPAGEQAVAVGIEDDVVGGRAGRAQRARHHRRPHGDIAFGIADHCGLAGGAGRSMHPNDIPHRHGEHPVGIVLAQVGLGGEREFGQIGQRFQIPGMDAGLIELGAIMRNIVVGVLQRPFESLQLQRKQFIATGDFDGFEPGRLQIDIHAHLPHAA